jgi:hypothetical protein
LPFGDGVGTAAPPNSPVIGSDWPCARSRRLICQIPALTLLSYL